MPRVQPKTISKDERRNLLNELWSLVILLETREQIENFFRDLLSETEAIMLARRIRIARFLLEGKSYDDIRNAMHTSHITIAGVHKWLQGRDGGYAQILPRLKKELELQQKAGERELQQRQPLTFGWLKKRYPLHFLLFNLLDSSEKPATKRKKRIQ